MKKYTEVKNKIPFDWNIALSKDCNTMTPGAVRKLAIKALSWVTCACGNQCAIIPREVDGKPINRKLRNLGINFFDKGIGMMRDEVLNSHGTRNEDMKILSLREANKYRRRAIKTLKKIEIQSGKLIEQEILSAKKVLIDLGYKVV